MNTRDRILFFGAIQLAIFSVVQLILYIALPQDGLAWKVLASAFSFLLLVSWGWIIYTETRRTKAE